MIEELIKKLEEIIKEYVILNDIDCMEELSFIKRINDIVLNNCNYDYDVKYRKKYSLNQIDKIVCDFLKEFDYDYYLYYQLRKNDGTIVFDRENKDSIPYSEYDYFSKKRTIYIPLKKTLEDAFSVIHELNHDRNIYELYVNDTRMIFTESLSILLELLFEDFLRDKKIIDYKVNNNYSLSAINYKSLYIDFVYKLINLYINNYKINYTDLLGIIKKYDNNQRKDLNDILSSIMEDEGVDIDFEFRYVLGVLIATYLYNRIKKNKKNVQEVFEMNDIINDYDYLQIFDYLDLEYEDDGLSNNAYETLKNNYKIYVKHR